MNVTEVVLQGTLKADGTLELDEKPNLPPGRVRITLAPQTPADQPGESVWSVLERIWAERKALGLPGRTREEIDAEINASRDEWEERMEELERIHDLARQAKEKPGC
jgi:hypothetical protein